MDRRDVLKLGALAGVGGSGCASLLSNPAAVSEGALSGFLAALDGAMTGVMAGQPFDRFFDTANNPALAARARSSEDLARKTLRSMLLVGTIGELPREQMAHQGVQQRLRDHMGEFDDAMFGMTDMLEGMGPAERADVSKALRDDPQLGMRIMGLFDEEAAAMGISFTQRTKLRSVSAHACARLRQSPELAINEYTGKVRKIAARHGARAEDERRAAAAIGGALLWGQVDGVDSAVGGALAAADGGAPEPDWAPPPLVSSEPIAPPRPCTTSKDCASGQTCENYRELGDGRWTQGQCVAPRRPSAATPVLLSVGGGLMGLGVVGYFLLGGTGVGLGLTVGAVLGGIGLVVLIVGLIRLAMGR